MSNVNEMKASVCVYTYSIAFKKSAVWATRNENQTFAKLVRHLFGFMTNIQGESVSNKLKLGFETSINENEILVSEHPRHT